MAVFAVPTAAVAADGETTTLTNNSYQQYTSFNCDSNYSECFATFPPTTYATTIVKAVSCFVNVTSGSFVGMQLKTNTGYQSFYMPGQVYLAFPGTLSVTVNASTYMFYAKGEIPSVVVAVEGGTFEGAFACTISGEHS
jgi:hypothetical protein